MAEHEPNTGASDEWYTPPEIFAGLGLAFDLDPAHPGLDHPHAHVPVRQVYTQADDGLSKPWHGLVWLNPPFGARNGQVPWLRRFLEHGQGIALVAARTSAGWFHAEVGPRAETLLFPRGKTQFVRGIAMDEHPAGSRGKSPGTGVVLIGMGEVANSALRRSGLGLYVDLRRSAAHAA